jgi:uncharacterized protein (TIGR03435 family)
MRNCLPKLFAAVVVFGSLNAASVQSQSVSFDVASIKLSPPVVPGQAVNTRIVCHSIDAGAPDIPLGRCVVLRRPLLDFVAWAYNAQRLLVDGGPDWSRSVAFDIEAKTEDPATATYVQLRSLFQTLLTDRFKLAFHREARATAGYLLVIAKNGPKLKNAPKDETPSALQTNSSATYRNGGVGLLVQFLSTRVGRPVIDKTGLTARYDIELTWSPSELEGPRSANTEVLSAPSLFTALQEQLGLRLESAKVPAEYLIVDHAEMPASN